MLYHIHIKHAQYFIALTIEHISQVIEEIPFCAHGE